MVNEKLGKPRLHFNTEWQRWELTFNKYREYAIMIDFGWRGSDDNGDPIFYECRPILLEDNEIGTEWMYLITEEEMKSQYEGIIEYEGEEVANLWKQHQTLYFQMSSATEKTIKRMIAFWDHFMGLELMEFSVTLTGWKTRPPLSQEIVTKIDEIRERNNEVVEFEGNDEPF